MTEPENATLVVGVGNDYRSDDGAGLAVVRQIREAGPAGVTVREETGDIGEMSECWPDFDMVILVDAVQSGAPAGTILRFDAQQEPLPQVFVPHVSSHGFTVAEAIALAQTLGRMPRRLIVYGIEGSTFTDGVGLSPQVEEAIAEVAHRIIAELRPHDQVTTL